MIFFLRIVGIMNAVVWCGGSVFFTFGVAPVFFSPAMKALLGDIHSGIVAQLVLERFFQLSFLCGSVAVLHMLTEWVYLGKSMDRFLTYTLGGILSLQILGGALLMPHMKSLHLTKYGVRSTPEQRASASRAFRIWHGVSQISNLIVLTGLVCFTWRIVRPTDAPRFVSTQKFWG